MSQFVALLRRVPHGIAWRLRRIVRPVTRRLRVLDRRRRAPRPAGSGSGRGRDIKEAYPRASRTNTYEAMDFLRSVELSRINDDLVARIRAEVAGGRALRVAFLVNDRSKWNGDSLVREMRQRGWTVRIHLCLTDAKDLSFEEYRESYVTERAFFSRIDPDLVDLYDPATGQVVPVEEIDADVVFLQQPWGMKAAPRRLTGRSLPVYQHYGFLIMANHGMHYNIGTFHPYLWRYFTQTEAHRAMHLAHDPSAYERLVVTGYPKLDVYLEGDPAERLDHPIWGEGRRDDRRVIFAPHHSLGADNLNMGTFRWTAQPMLHFARSNPSLRWVYKPHPTLRHSVVKNGVMTSDEYEAYVAAWAQLPNAEIYDSGDYFDIFRSSDVLVTDCGSFLAEYLPTTRPIVWLVQEGSIGLNEVGLNLARCYYDVHDADQLAETLGEVVLEGRDPLVQERAAAATTLLPAGRPAATAVVDHLADTLVPTEA